MSSNQHDSGPNDPIHADGARLVDAGLQAWNRKGALEEIDSLKLIRATSWEQHSHSFKWLNASLLALNGGGLLAVAQFSEIDPNARIAAGGLFSIGLAFALLIAVFGQRAIMAMLAPLQKQIGYWMTVSEDGVRDEEFEAELTAEMEKSLRLGYAGQAAGWFSALALFAGICASGSGLIEQERKVPNAVAIDVRK